MVNDVPVAFFFNQERLFLKKPTVQGLTLTSVDGFIPGDTRLGEVFLSRWGASARARMLGYTLQRALWVIPVLVGIATITFVLMQFAAGGGGLGPPKEAASPGGPEPRSPIRPGRSLVATVLELSGGGPPGRPGRILYVPGPAGDGDHSPGSPSQRGTWGHRLPDRSVRWSSSRRRRCCPIQLTL